MGKSLCKENGFAALSEICDRYWYPLYAHLRFLGESPEDAADLTQGFLEVLIDKTLLEKADRSRGKLRSFLIASLLNYRGQVYRSQSAQKRGGQLSHLSIDTDWAEERFAEEMVDDAYSPDQACDYRWAMLFFEHCLTVLQQEWYEKGRGDEFAQLYPYLDGKTQDQPSYPEIGEQLGISENAVRIKVHRLRQKFRETIENEAAKNLGNGFGKGFIKELRALFFMMPED